MNSPIENVDSSKNPDLLKDRSCDNEASSLFGYTDSQNSVYKIERLDKNCRDTDETVSGYPQSLRVRECHGYKMG